MVPRRRWDLENMKTDHQDSRIPNELLLGKKLEGGSKMNGRTMTGVDKSRLRQFSVEQNAKIFVKCLLRISLGCVWWCGWESDIKKRPTWTVAMGSGEVSWSMRTCPPPILIHKNKGSNLKYYVLLSIITNSMI